MWKIFAKTGTAAAALALPLATALPASASDGIGPTDPPSPAPQPEGSLPLGELLDLDLLSQVLGGSTGPGLPAPGAGEKADLTQQELDALRELGALTDLVGVLGGAGGGLPAELPQAPLDR